jgi:hypothetical protein
MFPTSHPDLMGQLASDRAERLRAEAASVRRARQAVARWRQARFVEPAADLHRVVPAPVPADLPAKADRAA